MDRLSIYIWNIRLFLNPLDIQEHGRSQRRAGHRDDPGPHRLLQQPVKQVILCGKYREKIYGNVGQDGRLHRPIFFINITERHAHQESIEHLYHIHMQERKYR